MNTHQQTLESLKPSVRCPNPHCTGDSTNVVCNGYNHESKEYRFTCWDCGCKWGVKK